MVLEINDITFTRGQDGILLSEEVPLELLAKDGEDTPTIKIKPLTRGRLQEIHRDATSDNVEVRTKADNDIILEGLVEPKFTEETIKDLKPRYANAISMAILACSLGVSQKEMNEKATEVLLNQEEALKKK